MLACMCEHEAGAYSDKGSAAVLGRCLYEREVRADPTPGDREWDDLSEAERESYCNIAEYVVRHYEAIMGLPAAVL